MHLLTVTALFATLLACVADVGEGKVKATVEDVPTQAASAPGGEAAPDGEAAPTPDAGDQWAVDPASSKIEALGAKITATHPIVFRTFEGTVGVHEGAVTSVAFTVQMDSLEADHPKLTVHLKDADFFDVPTHPTSTFTSTAITAGSDVPEMTHTVAGDFTIRGTTKRVTFPAKISLTDGKVEAVTEFVLDRQDFGVTYPGRPDDLVQDNVRMNISLVAVRS